MTTTRTQPLIIETRTAKGLRRAEWYKAHGWTVNYYDFNHVIATRPQPETNPNRKESDMTTNHTKPAPKPAPKPLDQVDRIIAFESGELTDEEVIALFQDLIDSGLVWQLQGSYGRAARSLIEAGHCHPAES